MFWVPPAIVILACSAGHRNPVAVPIAVSLRGFYAIHVLSVNQTVVAAASLEP